MTIREAYFAAIHADEAWSEELQRIFGRNAGDMRYMKCGQGQPGTALNAAWRRFRETTARWRHMQHVRSDMPISLD